MRYRYGIIAELTKHPKHQKTKTYSDIITFDTESSNVGGYSCTYLWSVCINGEYIYGRTPQECRQFFDELSEYEGKWYVWIHCLGFDSVYLEDVLGEFDSVFAIATHKPITIKWRNIRLRCTYALSNLKLEELADMYELKYRKGEMNHDLIRHYETPLTDEEWEYCRNDVLILYEYIKIMRDTFGGVDKIPQTFTGCAKELYKKYTWDYEPKLLLLRKQILNNAPKTIEAYNAARDTYHGAFNYCNPQYVNIPLTAEDGVRIISADIHSDYSYQMIANKYPTKLRETPKEYWSVGNFLTQPYAIATFVFKYLKLKEDGIPYLSKSQVDFFCTKKEKLIVDDKIIESGVLRVTLSSLDFDIIRKMYDYEVKEIGKMFTSTLDYLPLGMIMLIKDLYKAKSLATNPSAKATAKTSLNALSGMCAFDYTRADVTYSDHKWSYDKNKKFNSDHMTDKIYDWDKYHRRKINLNKPYSENHDNMTYTLYQWAGAITGYARRDLLFLDYKLGANRVLYNDTDCVKFICETQEDYEECMKILHQRDLQVDLKITQMCNDLNAKYGTSLTLEDFRPTDYDSTIGHMPVEHDYFMFKMLGTKKYLACDKINDSYLLNPVVAGANKQIVSETLLINTKSDKQLLQGQTILSNTTPYEISLIFDDFNNELIIPNACTSHNYTIAKQNLLITDYLSNTLQTDVTSGIIITNTPYAISTLPHLHTTLSTPSSTL